MNADDLAIFNRDIRASVSALGAELVRLQDGNGTDYLWNGDPTWWNGHSPILFPIVGELREGKLKVGGKTFAMARHGFARLSAFDVILRKAAHCTFRLRSNRETRAQYPFEFELRLDYEVIGRALLIRASISNTGADLMPSSFGFHPAFRWPLAGNLSKADYSIMFDQPENALVERPVNGLLSGTPRPSPVVGRRLELEDAIFEEGAFIFDRLESRRVVYGASRGPSIAVTFDGMPNLGIWSKPGAGFVCIEPWQGYASPKDFDGELRDKPGMMLIEPGAMRQLEVRIEIESGRS
jgi:galactose mutarotase-like enzyme